MSETKFTKGPWRIDPYYGKEAQRATHPNVCIVYASDSLSPICRVPIRKAAGEPNTPANVTERDEANAQLMAAAPDLYGALERTLDRLDKVLQSKAVRDISETIGEAQFALKKARGGQ